MHVDGVAVDALIIGQRRRIQYAVHHPHAGAHDIHVALIAEESGVDHRGGGGIG